MDNPVQQQRFDDGMKEVQTFLAAANYAVAMHMVGLTETLSLAKQIGTAADVADVERAIVKQRLQEREQLPYPGKLVGNKQGQW